MTTFWLVFISVKIWYSSDWSNLKQTRVSQPSLMSPVLEGWSLVNIYLFSTPFPYWHFSAQIFTYSLLLSARLFHVSSLPVAGRSWASPRTHAYFLLLFCLSFVDFTVGVSASLERVYDHPEITSARKLFFFLKECALKNNTNLSG